MDKNKKQIKRIGIDARFYGPVGKGLGRYTKEVVDRVIAFDTQNEYVIFLSKENYDSFGVKNSQVKKVLADVRWYTLAEQIKMPWLIYKEKIDLMHFPHFNVPIFCFTKFIVTIHDLILTKYPTQRASTLSPLLYKVKNLGYRIVINLAIKRAKKVIAVSEFTKNDIVAKFKVTKEKIIVIYEGVAKAFNLDNANDKKVIFRYNIEEPYLLYVGNAYPHKNLEGMIRIFSNIKKEIPNLKLVLVGKEDYFYKRVKAYALNFNNGKDIVFPGFVSDKDLQIVYKFAQIYIFTSLYEGFGLSPLEAMSQGCPVISSDKSCLPEVLGASAQYINPKNEEAATKIIIKIFNNKELREELIKKGLRQAQKYSWNKCAQNTLEIYNTRF